MTVRVSVSDALQALAEARWAAERARRDALSAELALALSEAYRDLGERERSQEWLGHAEATLARVGEDLRLESMVLAARAQLEGLLDRRLAASELALRSLALRSLALREQALGSEHLEVAQSLLLAVAYTPFDQLEAGAAHARRALDIRVAALGAAGCGQRGPAGSRGAGARCARCARCAGGAALADPAPGRGAGGAGLRVRRPGRRGDRRLRDAIKRLRAAKAFGSADATAARCRDRSMLSHRGQ